MIADPKENAKKRVEWTADEDDLIRRKYKAQHVMAERIAGWINRDRPFGSYKVMTVDVRNRAFRIGATRKERTRWTTEEDLLIAKAVECGRGFREVARKIGRTDTAVAGRAHTLRYSYRSLRSSALTLEELCQVIGRPHKRMRVHIDTGRLPAKNLNADKDKSPWVILRSDIREFILAYPDEVNLASCDVTFLFDLLANENRSSAAGFAIWGRTINVNCFVAARTESEAARFMSEECGFPVKADEVEPVYVKNADVIVIPTRQVTPLSICSECGAPKRSVRGTLCRSCSSVRTRSLIKKRDERRRKIEG